MFSPSMFLFVIITLMTLSCQALQISFNSNSASTSNTIRHEDPSAMVVKDTAQFHYESIIDDILSEHNEGLLTELSIVIKDPEQMYSIMKPQADVLFGAEEEIEDVCVAQLPGMIANQIHELSNDIYSSVDTIVTQFWKTSDRSFRQLLLDSLNKGYGEQDILDELTEVLEMVNMDIADRITRTVDDFQMLHKLKQSLVHCQTVFGQELEHNAASTTAEETLTEKIWNAVLISFSLSNPMESNLEQSGFMGRYIHDLRSDIETEIYSRVVELARALYEDLAFSS